MTDHIIGVQRPEGVEREEHDYYATCPTSIPPLLELIGFRDGNKRIWENSCGEGHLAEALSIFGHNVVATDLIDRGYGVGGVDFLDFTVYQLCEWDAIIMNPPYKHAQQFIEKSLDHAPIVCAFLRLGFLQAIDRKKFFENTPLKYVAVFSWRIKSSKSGLFPKGEQSATPYAWFVWDRSYTGEPIIKWF